MRHTLALLYFLSILTGCSRESLYEEADFRQNVYDAFADCSDATIKRLAMAHNIQTAFGRCGSNRFSHFSWAPDGLHLYFQLTHGSHILNGEDKTITMVPTESPTARAAWLSATVLAIPLPPEEEKTKERIAFYNRSALTIDYREIDVTQPRDLMRFHNGSAVLFTALDAEGVRRPYSLNSNTGDLSRALTWLEQPIERLSISEKAGIVAWSTSTDTEIAKLETGESLHLFKGVTRAVPHDDGRWVALETLGAEISHFDQRSWDEVSPKARERELARQKKWEEKLPNWVDTTVKPPEIQLFDLSNQQRHRITAFWGDEVEWYPAPGNWMAFFMWGIEGKQLNRNVGLTAMAERIRMLDAGQNPLELETITQTPDLDSTKAN
ncbi:MAG: hypothetical protein CL930_05435 [Deltaproteobacteria bacterium]|nr:hypothetical protein [Deltaproteobacteria bacterium]